MRNSLINQTKFTHCLIQRKSVSILFHSLHTIIANVINYVYKNILQSRWGEFPLLNVENLLLWEKTKVNF